MSTPRGSPSDHLPPLRPGSAMVATRSPIPQYASANSRAPQKSAKKDRARPSTDPADNTQPGHGMRNPLAPRSSAKNDRSSTFKDPVDNRSDRLQTRTSSALSVERQIQYSPKSTSGNNTALRPGSAEHPKSKGEFKHSHTLQRRVNKSRPGTATYPGDRTTTYPGATSLSDDSHVWPPNDLRASPSFSGSRGQSQPFTTASTSYRRPTSPNLPQVSSMPHSSKIVPPMRHRRGTVPGDLSSKAMFSFGQAAPLPPIVKDKEKSFEIDINPSKETNQCNRNVTDEKIHEALEAVEKEEAVTSIKAELCDKKEVASDGNDSDGGVINKDECSINSPAKEKGSFGNKQNINNTTKPNELTFVSTKCTDELTKDISQVKEEGSLDNKQNSETTKPCTTTSVSTKSADELTKDISEVKEEGTLDSKQNTETTKPCTSTSVSTKCTVELTKYHSQTKEEGSLDGKQNTETTKPSTSTSESPKSTDVPTKDNRQTKEGGSLDRKQNTETTKPCTTTSVSTKNTDELTKCISETKQEGTLDSKQNTETTKPCISTSVSTKCTVELTKDISQVKEEGSLDNKQNSETTKPCTTTSVSTKSTDVLTKDKNQTKVEGSLDRKQNIKTTKPCTTTSILTNLEKREYSLDISSGSRSLSFIWDGMTIPNELFNSGDMLLSSLLLTNHFIERIPSDIKQLATCLTVIDLSGNNVMDISCLANLPLLSYLDISGNLVQYIPKEFEKLSKLSTLNIQDNKVENILCTGIENLNFANLSSNKLKNDLDNVFTWKNLIDLNLEKNQIDEIPTNIKGLKKLEKLNFSRNVIQEIPNCVFELEKLSELFLRRNYVQNIALDGDIGQSRLEYLDISENYLKNLPSIKHLPQLRILNASKNFIRDIKNDLDGATNLEQVYLSDNNMSGFKSDPTRLCKLRYLDIKGNLFNGIPIDICSIPSLETLHMSHNCLLILKIRDLFRMSRLKTFDVSHNKLKKINGLNSHHKSVNKEATQSNSDVSNKSEHEHLSLTSLNMDGNDLCDLPEDLHGFKYLETLSLSENKFISLPSELRLFNNLKHLNVSGGKDMVNELQNDLFESYGCRTSLKYLSLAKQGLKSLPESISCLENLEEFDISSNYLTELPKQFKSLKNIRHLNLSKNNFREIPDAAFDGNKKLEVLNLSHNRNISRLGIKLFQMTSLRILHLEGCSLKHGSFSKIEKLNHLTELYLDDNKITQLPRTFEKLGELQVLSLNMNPLRVLSLPENMSWGKLEYLYLNKNYITSVPDEIENIKSLKHFDISGNRISETDHISRKIALLQNLEEIALNDNGLTKFPTHILENIHLKCLNVANNNILAIDDMRVDPRNNLETLKLQQNQLQTLPEDFAFFKHLKLLDISQNNISSFPEAFDEGIERLEYFHCVQNTLQELPDYISLSERNYVECIVSSNHISKVESWNTSTEKLSLEANCLEQFPTHIFDDMNLGEFSISSNQLSELRFVDEQSGLIPKTGLRILIASLNDNVTIYPGMRHLKYLTELELIKIGMEILPDDVRHLQYLKRLNVSGNKLRNVPAFFEELSLLQDIDISGNEIGDSGIKDPKFLLLKYLNKFNISHNILTEMPMPPKSALQEGQICKVESYSANNNEITSITRLIHKLKCVKYLNLKNNKLQSIPKEVFLSPSLEIIDVSGNNIEMIEYPEKRKLETTKLKELNLESNRLRYIDANLAHLLRLEILNLRNNCITHRPLFSGAFADQDRLVIQLEGNPIIESFEGESLNTYLKSSRSPEERKKVIKLILHGKEESVKQIIIRKILAETGCNEITGDIKYVTRHSFDNIDLVLISLDIERINLMQEISSQDTFHLICVPIKTDTNITANTNRFFRESVESYFDNLCFMTQEKIPLISIVACAEDQTSEIDDIRKNSLKELTERMVEQMIEFFHNSAMSDNVLRDNMQQEDMDEYINSISHQVFWNFSKEIQFICNQSVEYMLQNIKDLREKAEVDDRCPVQPTFNEKWKGIIQTFDQINRPTSTTYEMSELAINGNIARADIGAGLQEMLRYKHYTVEALTLKAGDATLTFHNPQWLFKVLAKLDVISIDRRLSIAQVKETIDKENVTRMRIDGPKLARSILEILRRQNQCYKVSNDVYKLPMKLETSDTVKREYLRMEKLLTDTPANTECIQMNFGPITRCPRAFLYEVLCATNEVVTVDRTGAKYRVDYIEGSYGKAKECTYVLLFEGKGLSKGYPVVSECKIALGVVGEVLDGAYQHGFCPGQTITNLDERGRFTEDHGFSSAYEVAEQMRTFVQSCARWTDLAPAGVSYRLGNPLPENFSTKMMSLVSNKIGYDWKQLARSLTLEEATIENIAVSNINLSDLAYASLLGWTKKQSSQATFAFLREALLEIERKDIADLIEKECKSQKVDISRPL